MTNVTCKRDFEVGAYNFYQDGKFIYKTKDPEIIKKSIIHAGKLKSGPGVRVTKDVKNGYNDSSIDVTISFFHQMQKEKLGSF